MTCHVTWMPSFAPTVLLNAFAIWVSSASSSGPEDQPAKVTLVTFCVLCPAWADAATMTPTTSNTPTTTAKRFVMSDDPPSSLEPVSKLDSPTPLHTPSANPYTPARNRIPGLGFLDFQTFCQHS